MMMSPAVAQLHSVLLHQLHPFLRGRTLKKAVSICRYPCSLSVNLRKNHHPPPPFAPNRPFRRVGSIVAAEIELLRPISDR